MRWLIVVVVFLFVNTLIAQDFRLGFTIGMNLNKFESEAEMDDAGNALETFDWSTGFMVGATFAWRPTELMGLRGELLFTQKGGQKTYNGPSYYIFTNTTGTRIFTNGTRSMSLDVANSYLSVPVMGYIKPVRWLEFYAGGHVSFMISSTAFGELTYEGKTASGSPIQKFTHEIDANYFGDIPLKMSFGSTPKSVQVGSEKVFIPQSGGAYFEFPTDRGNLYRVLELGVLGGMSIYFNRGLYLSVRATKGLTDITKDGADVYLSKLDANKDFISRSDADKNLTFHAAIGFTL